jgi:AcrR family transcriptional regulator
MAEARADRRVRRTKQRLKEALLELIAERGYEGLTVADVTERADVGRSTFYTHYGSLEDLLFAGWDAWVLSLADVLPAEETEAGDAARMRFSLPLLRHMRTQKRFVLAVLHGTDVRLRRRITEIVAAVAARELDRMSPAPAAGETPDAALRRKGRATALAAAYVGLAGWWMDAGARLAPEAVDEIFQGLVATAGPRAS